MFVESPGRHPYCAYLSPAPTRGLGSGALCDTSTKNVTGANAPGANVSFSWEFSPSLRPGFYTIGIYDQHGNGGAGAVLSSMRVNLTR